MYDSVVDGEYLGWHSRNLRLGNCRISGKMCIRDRILAMPASELLFCAVVFPGRRVPSGRMILSVVPFLSLIHISREARSSSASSEERRLVFLLIMMRKG